MAGLADLRAAFAHLSERVDLLIAKAALPPPAPEDVQPDVDAVNALAAKVDAALGPPPA